MISGTVWENTAWRWKGKGKGRNGLRNEKRPLVQDEKWLWGNSECEEWKWRSWCIRPVTEDTHRRLADRQSHSHCMCTAYITANYIAQTTLDTFPRIFHVDGKVWNLLRTCWRLGELSWPTHRVANKSTTSRCNGILETTRHNRHNRLLPPPTCYGLATGKLVPLHIVASVEEALGFFEEVATTRIRRRRTR